MSSDTRKLNRLERFTRYLENQLVRFNNWYSNRQWEKHDNANT